MTINILLDATLRKVGILKRIPEDATSPDERETIGRVKCSDVYAPLSGIYAVQKQFRERSNSAQLAQARTIYVSPEYEIDSSMRIEVIPETGSDSKEYRIRDVTRWPDVEPAYYELLVEDD